MDDFGARATTPPAAVPFRMIQCIWRQRARTRRCQDTPRLDGKLAVVTGGNAGIGLEISRGLAARGAEVIIAARNAATAGAACDASGLGGEGDDSFFRRRIMIDCVAGAQTPLWCATQPIESGAYYHNTMGKMLLRQTDAARDDVKAAALWQRMEELVG